MKRTLFSMLAAVAAAVLPGAIASAQEITYASHAEIMSVLERQNQRIAELEAGASNGGGCSSCGGGSCTSCGDCCNSCCDPCVRSSGVVGGAEITFVKFHHTGGVGGPITVNDPDLAFGYETAPRLWAGWQGSDGLGVRTRYWEFNHHNGPVATPFGDEAIGVDTYAFDVEFFDSMNLGCYWDATWFAGFRYVEYDENRTINGVILNAQDFAGYGLTAGSELRRCIGNNLAGFVNARGSVLMGDETDTFGAVPLEQLDSIKYIWEAQAGAQYTLPLEDGGYLFARAAVEVQYWTGMGAPLANDGAFNTNNVGFGGGLLSVGIIR